MYRSFKMGRSSFILILIIPLMTLISFAIYLEYIKTKENVFEIIQEHLINEKLQLFEKYANYMILHTSKNIKNHIQNNNELSAQYEQNLKLLQGDKIKYLYLLYKDNDGKFRYLLDATEDINEKAEFDQKFDPLTDIWDMAYKTKSIQTAHHKELQTLWISIAYPLVVDGDVIAVLGADFTHDVYTKIVDTLNPMESIYLYVSSFMVIMLFIAYTLVFMYYTTRKKAFIDPLTKVYNRQYLAEFLETTSLQDYHLMMIDLDHFKLVNDNFGHDAGDEVLISVVTKIKSQIRQEDILIRFGGEEFVLLVYKKELKDSIVVAHRIREAVMNSIIETKNNQVQMTLSIGVNPFPYYAKNIEEAIKIADEQLYIAKSSGRNRVEVFNENDKGQCQTSKRISDIQLAIDENRIKCAYQPIFSNNSKKVVKYEMLLRLIDQEGEIVLPNEFLPSIRHTQVYINLTRCVLDIAIKTLKENSFDISINLDIQDILNNDILNLLKNKFSKELGFTKRLTIEILEHEEITNFELIQERITMLKELGFTIALDDFGSGYANFRYLLNLDIDILKIDGSIIQNIDKDKVAYNIVKTIVEFAKNMDMKTVAEQVETQDELKKLNELDIDYIQGNYIGCPEFHFIT